MKNSQPPEGGLDPAHRDVFLARTVLYLRYIGVLGDPVQEINVPLPPTK